MTTGSPFTWFGVALLLLVAVTGFCIVQTRDVTRQVLALTFYGLLFALVFFVFQAPDVALSQITVGGVALPLMIMLAISRIRHSEKLREQEREK